MDGASDPTAWLEDGPCPVSSHNEWDPLEEVIVGRVEGAAIPGVHVSIRQVLPRRLDRMLPWIGGWHYPRRFVEAARRELDEFIHILEAEGAIVRRPEPVDFRRKFRTPHWSSRGFACACPRDGFLVIGNEIIETPMSWPSRHFEGIAYRPLFKEYFARGARWTAAPRPELRDELYDANF